MLQFAVQVAGLRKRKTEGRIEAALFIKLLPATTMTLTEQQRQVFESGLTGILTTTTASLLALVEEVQGMTEPAPPQIWRPGKGDYYCYLDSACHVIQAQHFNTGADQNRVLKFNAFPSREKAEAVSRWQTAQRHLLAIADAKNAGWKPTPEECGWALYYSYGRKAWVPVLTSITGLSVSTVLFRTEDLAHEAIEEMGSDIDNLLLEQA